MQFIFFSDTGILPKKVNLTSYFLMSMGRTNKGWSLNNNCINKNLPRLLTMIHFLSFVYFPFVFVLFFLFFSRVFLKFVPEIIYFSCFASTTIINSSVWFQTWYCVFSLSPFKTQRFSNIRPGSSDALLFGGWRDELAYQEGMKLLSHDQM